MLLQSKAISHWLGTSLESALTRWPMPGHHDNYVGTSRLIMCPAILFWHDRLLSHLVLVPKHHSVTMPTHVSVIFLPSFHSYISSSWVRHVGSLQFCATISVMVSQITCISTICPGADQRKHQSSASLDFVKGNPLVTAGFALQKASNRKCLRLMMPSCHSLTYILSL